MQINVKGQTNEVKNCFSKKYMSEEEGETKDETFPPARCFRQPCRGPEKTEPLMRFRELLPCRARKTMVFFSKM